MYSIAAPLLDAVWLAGHVMGHALAGRERRAGQADWQGRARVWACQRAAAWTRGRLLIDANPGCSLGPSLWFSGGACGDSDDGRGPYWAICCLCTSPPGARGATSRGDMRRCVRSSGTASRTPPRGQMPGCHSISIPWPWQARLPGTSRSNPGGHRWHPSAVAASGNGALPSHYLLGLHIQPSRRARGPSPGNQANDSCPSPLPHSCPQARPPSRTSTLLLAVRPRPPLRRPAPDAL